MQNIMKGEIEEVARQILWHLYKIKKPQNKDRLKEICDWWLTQERLNYAVKVLTSAIELLLSRKLIIENNVSGAGKIYRINRSKSPEVVKIITTPIDSFAEILRTDQKGTYHEELIEVD